MKVRLIIVVFISVLVLIAGALYQSFVLMEQTPNVDVQVIKKASEILKGTAPAFVYGKFAEMIDHSSNAVYDPDNLEPLKNMMIYERKLSGNDLKSLANNLKLESRAECFIVVDGKGKVLLRSNEDKSGDVIIGIPIVKRALSGSISGDTMEMKNRPMLVAGVPVADEKGVVIGAVVFGFPLDSKTMLDIWDQQISAHIALVWKNKIMASSFAPLDKIVQEGIDKHKYVNGFTKVPPEGDLVDLGSGRRVVVFGVAGSLKGRVGFVVSPRKLSEFAGVDIFGSSLWLFIAAGIAVFISILGSFWVMHSFDHDIALLVERLKTVAEKKDPSILQPQAFNKDISPVATAVREAMAAIIAFADKKRSTNSALEIPKELRELKGDSAGIVSGPAAEVAPPPTEAKENSKVAMFDELIGSALAGDATAMPPKPEPEPANMPEQPKPEEPKAEQQNMDDLESLVAAMQQDLKKQDEQQPDMTPPSEKSAEPKQSPKPVKKAVAREDQKQEEMVKVTLHGGPGGIPVVKPEDLQMSDEDRVKQQFEKVFAEYVALRKQLGESVDKLSKEKFLANLTQNRQRIMQKFQCRDVKFTVFNKNGKASVKATPVK